MLTSFLKPLPGIFVELAISWLLLWWIEKRNLSALGLIPTKKRLLGFVIFFLVTALCCSAQFIMRMWLVGEQWQVNPSLSGNLIIQGTWWNLMSVLYEELIFRGAILYILIKKIGAVRAITISAIAFGVYHWFSFGQLGNYGQMAFTFVTTGLFGLLLAYAFYKSSSLLIPVAIHLGWNIINGLVFSQGPIGNGIFIPVADQPKVLISHFLFFIIMALPLLVVLGLNFYLLRKHSMPMQS